MRDTEAQNLLERKQIGISDFVNKIALRFTCYSSLPTPHDKNLAMHDIRRGLRGNASCTYDDFHESLADSTCVIGIRLDESHGLHEKLLVSLYRQLYYVLAARELGGISR